MPSQGKAEHILRKLSQRGTESNWKWHWVNTPFAEIVRGRGWAIIYGAPRHTPCLDNIENGRRLATLRVGGRKVGGNVLDKLVVQRTGLCFVSKFLGKRLPKSLLRWTTWEGWGTQFFFQIDGRSTVYSKKHTTGKDLSFFCSIFM